LRTDKKVTRFRLKKLDKGGLIFHNKLPYTKERIALDDDEIAMKTCGLRSIRESGHTISKN